ncbi:MAG: nucleoside deaminase [Chloroflexi bacterium]|nr:MAG: nucleoside deaminase [Chloroflexota bacterium]
MSNSHQIFIEQTIELANQAKVNGNHPFGALLVWDGEVVLTAVNTVNTQNDITHHAELNLISAASRQFSSDELAEMTLYTSTEPCAMCAGAIYWSGIRKVVYGCSANTLGRIAGDSLMIPCREVLVHGAEPTDVIGPLLESEAEKVHHGFW